MNIENIENINKVYKVKVRPELEAFGSELTKDDVEILIQNLPISLKIANNEYSLDSSFKQALLEHTKKQFGFTAGQHVYIEGSGIYNDSEEIELDKNNWHFYNRHKQFLNDYVYINKPEIVESIDYETDQIIKKFPKPEDHTEFNKRGLVIGHVQSGKTANFTHLIAKAASIGYRFIIVLAGMTDTLRMQTQFRLDKELIGRNSAAIPNLEIIHWLPGEEKFCTLTQLPDERVRNDNGDFTPPASNFTDHFENTTDVTVVVVKKLARSGTDRFGSILGSLINWIECAYENDTINNVPTLIIDDEADQASIDGSADDDDPTVINHAIRKLVSIFPKSVYVGYTATPFANVFISPSNEYIGLDDLYPKDFIYSLPEPEKYFGSNRFFGTRNKNDELALIEYVEDNEKKIINDEEQSITSNLTEAIDCFIFSIIIRRFRENDNFCGMMIHTDHRNQFHNTVYSKVREYVLKLDCTKNKFQSFLKFIKKSNSIGRLQAASNKYPNYDYTKFNSEYNEVLSYLKKLKDEKTLNIKVINSREDKLDYLREELKYLICIGGNIMSRGVTIEGLTTTYYLRDTPKYDTLLQMGRWFGYRNGYQDLLRVYTTTNISDNFEFVMGVEDDLRNEVKRYIEEGLTPLDFAPKIRAHMKMYPTAKMGNAQFTRSYSQQAIQTIYFSRNIDALVNNFTLGTELLESYKGNFIDINHTSKKIASGCEIEDLENLIRKYNYSEFNSFDTVGILKYIEERRIAGEINDFDILVSSINQLRNNASATDIANFSINPVKRNIRKSNGRENIEKNIVNLGVISDTADIKLAENNDKLTLIIYFIDRNNSDAFNTSHLPIYNSNELNFNPLGFTIVFPKTNIANGEINYYQQVFQ